MADVFGSDSSDDEHEITLSTPKQVQDLLKERPKDCGVLRLYALRSRVMLDNHTHCSHHLHYSFHNGTEQALLLHVERTAVKENAQSVLAAIDLFCYSRHWFALGSIALSLLLQVLNGAAYCVRCIQDDAYRRPEGQSYFQSRQVKLHNPVPYLDLSWTITALL